MKKCAGLATLLLLSACSAPFRSTIVITEPELQTKVEKKFPLEKRVAIAKLSLENPRVALVETTDKVALDLDALVRLGPIKYMGTARVIGDLVFESNTSTIYFRNAEVTSLQIPNLPEKYVEPVRDTATEILRIQLDHVPVHELDGSSERMFVKSIVVRDRKVLVEVGI